MGSALTGAEFALGIERWGQIVSGVFWGKVGKGGGRCVYSEPLFCLVVVAIVCVVILAVILPSCALRPFSNFILCSGSCLKYYLFCLV